MTVWCSSTKSKTEPSEYFVPGCVTVSSIASLMAMPSEPVWSGFSREDASGRTAVSGLGLATTCGAVGLHQVAPVRLLVVRGADHVDLDLEPEDRAGEGQRAAPLAGARLGREPLDALLLVVERLGERGVGLVAARRADALVLVVDVRRRIERLLEPMGAVAAATAGRARTPRAPAQGSRSRGPG